MEAINLKCGNCGREDLTREWPRREDIPVGERGIVLCVFVPVLTCDGCDFSWTDWRGEGIRSSAAAKYFALETELSTVEDALAALLAWRKEQP